MIAYRPRMSVVPKGEFAGDYLERVLMPHWAAAKAPMGVRCFLLAVWSFHSSGSTYAPLRRLAARMGSSTSSAAHAQAKAVELGLLVVTEEVDRKVVRTVRTIVVPVDNPSVCETEGGPSEGGASVCETEEPLSVRQRASVCETEPSKDKEQIKELRRGDDQGYPQPSLFDQVLLAMELRDEYLLARTSDQALYRDFLAQLIHDGEVWLDQSDPERIATKVLTGARDWQVQS